MKLESVPGLQNCFLRVLFLGGGVEHTRKEGFFLFSPGWGEEASPAWIIAACTSQG